MSNKDSNNRVVLAFGEVTGHAHAFYEPIKVELKDQKFENNDVLETIRVLNIKEDNAFLEHEEHTKHEFFVGEGEVRIQNEYQMGEVKKAID